MTGNENADRLAQQGASKPEIDNIDTYVPRNFDLQGAKLSKITQKSAYKKIMNQTHVEYSRKTLAMLDVSRYAIESIMATIETDKTLWRSV